MNAFEHQLSILTAIAAGKAVEVRKRCSAQPEFAAPDMWVRVSGHPHLLNFTECEYRIAPPGAQPVWAVWDNEAGRYSNQLFDGPAAATTYAVSGNAACKATGYNETRFIPVKLQRVPDGA